MNRRATGLTLVGLGTVLLVLGIGAAPADLASAIVGMGPFLLIAVAISFVGGWIIREEEPVGEYGEQVLAWTFGAAITFAAIGYLITIDTAVQRTGFALPVSVLQAFTAGSLAGILVGVYEARSRNRFDELQLERNRVERFARKAKSLNTYGKALNQSRDVHDVSALSVEVLELLIESSESAVVVVTEDSTTVLDATMTGELGEFIEEIATSIAASPEMETVRCPNDIDCSIPDSVPVREVLGVPIAAGNATVVLLALTRSADAYTDEDLDLLESLSAHVGTALPNLERDVTEVTG
ncbi:MAG: GAF domain-containing protein [Halodesulfurarchaeum sp.]